MSTVSATEALVSMAARSLAGFGHVFERHQNHGLIRHSPDGVDQFILFGVRRDANDFAGSANVGLGLTMLAQLLCHERSDSPVHVAFPIHLLPPKTTFQEWRFRTMSDLGAMQETVGEELLARAVPFFEEYATLAAVKKALRPSKQDPLHLTDETRELLNIAITWHEGARDEAQRLLQFALERVKGELPKKQFRLKALKDRLAKI